MTLKRLIVLIVCLLSAGVLLAQDTPPFDHTLVSIPVEGAVCARGTPYSFAVRDGDPSRLMIYFQGGGACWNDRTCRPGDATFDDSVRPDELRGRAGGAFDFSRDDNPLRDYLVVVVMYCTGDVHVGAADVTYGTGESAYTVQHHGATNAIAVLEWTFEQFPDPAHLVIAGSSAGSYGAIYHAPRILAHYAGVPALVFGDAGIGAVNAGWQGIDTWNGGANQPEAMPPLVDGGVDEFTFSDDLYRTAAAAFPEVTFAEFSTAADATQTAFYFYQFGVPGMWADEMLRRVAARNALPNYRSYIAPGDYHTILPSPQFYRETVDDVAFRDWFAGLVAGEDVANVNGAPEG